MSITRAERVFKHIYDMANRLKKSEITLPGNVLLVTAFISYMGCFTKKYRMDLMNLYWIPFLNNLQVPILYTPDLDPLSLMTDDATIAQWNNDGKRRVSNENSYHNVISIILVDNVISIILVDTGCSIDQGVINKIMISREETNENLNKSFQLVFN